MLQWEEGEYRIQVDCRPEGPGYCRGSVTILRRGDVIRSENHLAPMPHGGCEEAERELLRRTQDWFFAAGAP